MCELQWGWHPLYRPFGDDDNCTYTMCTSYTYTTSHTTHHKQHRQYMEELVYIGEDYKLHDNT
ncbi:hypothetical protein Scep_030844 [Stephania cephalantha]|uniref:Uncharacterized protein n=1 Tax=Stephania cephalantha TaxID=152367 RepID=A0AAP0HDI4_9MAGN